MWPGPRRLHFPNAVGQLLPHNREVCASVNKCCDVMSIYQNAEIGTGNGVGVNIRRRPIVFLGSVGGIFGVSTLGNLPPGGRCR